MKGSRRSDIHDEETAATERGRGAHIDVESLFRHHAAWLARYVTHLGFRGQDVEDIVQETFLVAHRHGGFREGEARPTTWLAEIALRISMAKRRYLQRLPVAEPALVDALTFKGADPHRQAVQGQRLSHVQAALDSLKLEQRALFVLFEIEGESCETLATAFRVPIGTIYSRLHAARRDFLAAYNRLSGERIPPRRVRRAR